DSRRKNAPFGGHDVVLVPAIPLEQKAQKRVWKYGRLPAGNERHTLAAGFGRIEARLPAHADVHGQLPRQADVVLEVHIEAGVVRVLAPGGLLLPVVRTAK